MNADGRVGHCITKKNDFGGIKGQNVLCDIVDTL